MAKLSAVRSPVSRARAGASISTIRSPGETLWPSHRSTSTAQPGARKAKTAAKAGTPQRTPSALATSRARAMSASANTALEVRSGRSSARAAARRGGRCVAYGSTSSTTRGFYPNRAALLVWRYSPRQRLTSRETCAMCSAVVPQHPPTRRAPAAIQARAQTAKRAGEVTSASSHGESSANQALLA